MTDSTQDKKEVYGPNFNKAKKLAIKRSSGKCQFCGLREAREGHHWAWDYPSDEKVQGHDITALCTTCHELATMLRDWVQRKHADFDEIEKEIEASNSFYQKREAFSYWIFPEEEEAASLETPSRNFNARASAQQTNTGRTEGERFTTKSHAEIKRNLNNYELQIQTLTRTRNDLKRRMNASIKPSNWRQLKNQHSSTGRQMAAVIKKKRGLEAEQKKMGPEKTGCLALLVLIAFTLTLWGLT